VDITVSLPTAIEGTWSLVAEDGTVMASSEKLHGAKLIIQPIFYANAQVQTMARVAVKGNKGSVNRQALKISGNKGLVKVENSDAAPKPISCPFDKQVPEKKDKVKKDERTVGIGSNVGTKPANAQS